MKSRGQMFLGLIVLGIGALLAFIVGLWGYVSLTAPTLHPDAQQAPSVPGSTPPPSWAGAAQEAEQIARAALAEQNLPGLSVAVGVGREVVWTQGFGWANLHDQVKVTPATRFRTGDVSKALTSAAAGLVIEQQLLNLDAEIQTYVPEYPKKKWPVTVRQLMAQVAGVRTDGGDEAPIGVQCEQTLDALQLFADGALLSEPGTQYRPSSWSWVLVSAAVEAAADERFFRFMRSKIFEPLGMNDTLPDNVAEDIPNRTTFYFPRFGGDPRYGPELAREGDHSCWAGGGAFLSTPSDLVRFGLAVNGGRLLEPETVQLLQTPQRLSSGEETGYGLGWRIETVPLAGTPTRMAGHGTTSDFIGTTAYLMTFPEREIVVAVMTNTAFGDAKTIASKVADAFAQHVKRPPAK